MSDQNGFIVSNSNKPLRLNVGYLYNKAIGTIRDIPVDFDQLTIDDLKLKDLKSTVRISRTREGLLLQLNAEAEVQTECVRCLKEFFLPVKFEFEELYQFPSRYRQETDQVLPEDGYIDLSSLYREYLILALPIKPLCREECRGLCEECGADLNVTSCSHYPAVTSSEYEDNE